MGLEYYQLDYDYIDEIKTEFISVGFRSQFQYLFYSLFMKQFLATIIFFCIYISPSFSDSHKTKFKDIKGFKKQFISMSEKKANRIKEVKKSDGFPVYEGETSIQFTVNREDAGCGKGKAQTTQIQCDGKGNRSRQELHLGDMKTLKQ